MAAKKKSAAKKAPAKKTSARKPRSQTDEPGKGRGIWGNKTSAQSTGRASVRFDKQMNKAYEQVLKSENYKASGNMRKAEKADKKASRFFTRTK